MRNGLMVTWCNHLPGMLAVTALTCVLAMFPSGPAQGGTANPSAVNFGNVPINTTVTRNVAMTIDAGYYIANPSGAGASPPWGFAYGTCVGVGGFTGPGTCTAIASFTPTSFQIVGSTADILECPVSGGIGFCPSISYTVQGKGVSVAGANPSLVDFGNVQLLTTAHRNVTLTVDAGFQIAAGSGTGGGFNLDGGTCGDGNGFTGPGTCVFDVGFFPVNPGLAVGYFDIIECSTPVTSSCVQVLIHFDLSGNGVAVGPPVVQSALSRKVHGAAGTFDLPLSLTVTAPTTEPRQGPIQTIVFTFDKPANAAKATITEGTATAAAPTFSGNDVIVGLTGVTNQQYVTVSLTNVASSDGGTGGVASARIGFLAGDVNQSRVVTVADLGLVNAQLAQPVTPANFLKDVNASGTLTVADKGITNANLTHALPAP